MQELSGSKSKAMIFACTSKSEKECLDRMLFSSNKIYSESVLQTRKGDALFLYNMDTDILHGVFRAASDGGKNIVLEAWKGNYPYQVKVEPDGELKSIPQAKKVLTKLGVDRRYPLDSDRAKHLLELFKSPGEKWGDFIENSMMKETEDPREFGKPTLEATTLWDYPKQSYGRTPKGNNKYAGVTPAFIIYNLLFRYTEPGDTVLDPMAGSGTTLDVCREEGRNCIVFDIAPPRPDVKQNDARKLPLEDDSVDMVFVDSPYGDNIRYNDHPDNIGNISAETEKFYDEIEKVISECHRAMKPGKVIGWLIGDQWVKKHFTPVGFKVYERLCKYFETVDVICVVRRSQSSNTGIWYNRALRFNFYLRGFKYLFIMRKREEKEESTNQKKQEPKRNVKWAYYERQKSNRNRADQHTSILSS